MLPPGLLQDPERRARFEREARLLASLSHPNIAAIYGVEDVTGPDGVSPVLILEFVEGQTLAERIAGGPVPVDETVAIARQVTEALEAAHERGVIHRDLKPANVQITRDGSVKVLDFGLAKALDAGWLPPPPPPPPRTRRRSLADDNVRLSSSQEQRHGSDTGRCGHGHRRLHVTRTGARPQR